MWPVRALAAVFWAVFFATVGWVTLSNWDYGFAVGLFGEKGSRLATTLLLGALALTSGLLVLRHRQGDDDHYWTGAELVYALVLFAALFSGIYSFFGWFFYA